MLFHRIIKGGNVSESFTEYYKKYKKTYNKIIYEAKKLHNEKYIIQSCNKSKAMWDVIKQETGKRGETIRNYKMNYENSTIVDPKEIS